jgi:hypothetical protein
MLLRDLVVFELLILEHVLGLKTARWFARARIVGEARLALRHTRF